MTVRGNDERQQLGLPTEPLGTPDPAPRLAHVTEQPGLPVKFDSKRGCDQIRARLYHDHRLTGLELTVALALSEFVNPATYAAYPKQARVARMVHATRARVSNALQRLETKGVLEIDRCRTYCRYIFRGEWRGIFKALPRPSAPDSRCAGKAHQDVPEKHITGEPVQGNQVQAAAAPAVLLLEPVDQQQRIEGMLASCEISCRETGRPAFETELHRDWLRSGELTIEQLQAFTNELRAEREAEKWRVRL